MLEPIKEDEQTLEKKFFKNTEDVEKTLASNLLKTNEEAISKPEMLERKEGRMEKDNAYAKILAKTKNPITIMQSDISLDAKIANDEANYEDKIIKLVEIAQIKGIPHAVKVAKHIEDNYLLDELHDRLLAVDLHDALVEKGMITEI